MAKGKKKQPEQQVQQTDAEKSSEPERAASQDLDTISSFEKLSMPATDDESGPSARDSPTNQQAQAAGALLRAEEPAATQGGSEIEPADDVKADSKGYNSPPQRHVDPVVKELEEAAAVAAAATKEAAAVATQKILKGAADAKAFMSSLWSAFDDPATSAAKEKQAEEELRQQLGLGADEAILEVFRCKIIQEYHAKNAFTPPKNIAFSGLLHVAAAHVCVQLDGAAGEPPAVCLPKAELKSVVREGDAIRLGLSGDRALVLGAFSLPKFEVESAMSLLSSLCDTTPDDGVKV